MRLDTGLETSLSDFPYTFKQLTCHAEEQLARLTVLYPIMGKLVGETSQEQLAAVERLLVVYRKRLATLYDLGWNPAAKPNENKLLTYQYCRNCRPSMAFLNWGDPIQRGRACRRDHF